MRLEHQIADAIKELGWQDDDHLTVVIAPYVYAELVKEGMQVRREDKHLLGPLLTMKAVVELEVDFEMRATEFRVERR